MSCSLFSQLVRKLPGSAPFLWTCRRASNLSIANVGSRIDPHFIESHSYISRLVQRNTIPLGDVLPKSGILDQTNANIVRKIDMPKFPKKVDIEPRQFTLDDPNTVVEKKAHVMLRIKRKKMNRHRYEKRQRKKRFVYLRIRRVRYAKRESEFRAEIGMKLKELEKFDPAEYVNSRLEKYRQIILPNRIHGGVRMPPFVVTECLEKMERLRQQHRARQARKEKFMAENGGTLDVKS